MYVPGVSASTTVQTVTMRVAGRDRPMSRRLPLVALWITAGYGVAAGLFWACCRCPSRRCGCSASRRASCWRFCVALLWVTGGVLLAWHPQIAPMRAFVSGLSAGRAVAAGALLFGAIWWARSRSTHLARGARRRDRRGHHGQDRRVEHRPGCIARSCGRSGCCAGGRASRWRCRWRPGSRLAGPSAIGAAGWVAAGYHPKRWTVILALTALCFMLPWRFVYWRPPHLSLDDGAMVRRREARGDGAPRIHRLGADDPRRDTRQRSHSSKVGLLECRADL